MRRFPLGLSVLLAGLSVQAVADAADRPADPDAERLSRFAFEPIEKVMAAGRNVRRVSFADIYDDPTLPGVILERKKSGQIILTIVSAYGRTVDAAVLRPEAWTYVTAHDADGLAPGSGERPREICHGASVIIEASLDGAPRRREAGVCGGKPDEAAMDYARLVAEVAVTSIPRCAGFIESGREYSWILRECLNRTARRLLANPYSTATGDNHEVFRSFAITTSSLMRDDPIVLVEQ